MPMGVSDPENLRGLRMRRQFSLGVVALAAAATLAGYALAQDDMIAKRQALMKDNGANAMAAGQMVQGATPYDAAAAKAAMEKIAANAAEIPADFPAGSEGGKALPAIWANFADFEAKAAALKTAADAAAAAADGGVEAFGPAFGAVGQACGGCHQAYRQPS
jgi:cytochrome c556